MHLMGHDNLATDHVRSWIVAACCCFCNLTFYGVSRLSGIMLVAATHTFQVSRASAAVPFSLSTAIRNLAGVFVGHLGHRFGVGPIVAIGCLLASIGSGLCFFAKDMQWLTLCWGGLFGIGFGLSTCLLPLAINQNFTKHNGTASGISYSGSYIGSFIFPPIIVWLLDRFGLQGTFLVISGGILNVLIAAILLREPKNGKKRPQIKTIDGQLEQGVTVQCDPNTVVSKDSELLKQNIAQAYLSSQNALMYGNIDKLFPNSNVFCSCSRPFQKSLCNKSSSENENNPNLNCKSNCELHSEKNNHNLIYELLKNFEFKDINSSAQEFSKASIPGTLQTPNMASDFSITSREELDQHKNQHTDICFANDTTRSSISNAKQVLVVPKEFNKMPYCELKSLSKGKSRAKYKLKLQKLKKVLAASLLHRAHCFKTEYLPKDNVKLISIKYLQPFWCSFSPDTIIPNKLIHLSSPRGILGRKNSIGERNYSTFRFMRKFSNYSTTAQKVPKSEEIILFSGPHERLQSWYSLDNFVKGLCSSGHNKCQCRNRKFSASSINDIRKSSCSIYPSTHNCKISRNCGHSDISCRRSSTDIPTSDMSNIYKTADDNHVSCHKPNSPHQFLELGVEIKPTQRMGSLKGLPNSCSVENIVDNKKCFPELLLMLCEPMFVVISITMSIQTFTVVCVVTTIEDFAKDVGIPENRVHYALMALSIANLVGTLTLGIITDKGIISRHRFLSICFLGMALSLVAVSLVAVSLPSLLSLVVIYGLLESGVVITFPILTKQFVKGEKRQAVAIASSNVLSAPTVMLVPMLIGHFRDNIGCYSGLFHLLGATSFTCSLLWLVAPSIMHRENLKKSVFQENTQNC